MLALENEAPPLEVARELLFSRDPWARFHSAIALRGPWGVDAIAELERALDDVEVLSDMDHLYRVSDVAALAVLSMPRAPGSEALRSWFFRVRRELQGSDASLCDLATYVLAELGETEAFARLQQLADEDHQWQAQDVLERIRKMRDEQTPRS
jgi:hypothetical protein